MLSCAVTQLSHNSIQRRSTIVDNILRNTIGTSAVFATRNPRPGNLSVILDKCEDYLHLRKVLRAYHFGSAPSPIHIKAVFTFGSRFITLVK